MNKRALFAIVGAAVCANAPQARAEIPLVSAKGWDLTLDGRVNTFVSFAFGDSTPKNVPQWQGFYDYPDASGSLMTSRLRTGFIQNVLGFTLKKSLGNDNTLTVRFAPWVGVSYQRSKIDYPPVDVREVYFKVDGPWGGVLAGRNLSLFSRGPILQDYDIEHNYGLGSPCSLTLVTGGACGHAGFGILFPAFNAGIVYNTPEVAGFQLSAGMFDPAAISEATYDRTPFPRIEGELTFKVPKYFNASVSGEWQRLGKDDDCGGKCTPFMMVDAVGVAASAGVNLGPVQLGAAGFYAIGGGIYAPLENYPLFADDHGVLRHQQGVLGQASLTLGNTKIAGGLGLTQILKTVNDIEPFTTSDFQKEQFGGSFGVYQHINESLVVAAEYFRATYSWYQEPDSGDPTKISSPVQNVNLVNVGGTVVF
jgi:hypothetical protein